MCCKDILDVVQCVVKIVWISTMCCKDILDKYNVL